MDLEKVQVVESQLVLYNKKEVEAFLGFTNFYRQFVKGFSNVVGLLNELKKKDVSFRQKQA